MSTSGLHTHVHVCAYMHTDIYMYTVTTSNIQKMQRCLKGGWVKVKEAYLQPRAAGRLLRMLASALEENSVWSDLH